MDEFPNPGFGYTIRQKLGSGNWKTAYRATSMHSATDVAILYFHDESMQRAFTGEVLAQLRAAKGHVFSDYIAEFKGLQHDEDGHWYIIEELLARPLDKIGIVNDIVRFVRIARDLCRGLTCLHDNKLIHRDIKLENCGLDHQERAKIFDLGLVTSDPQDVRGNIFTRSPELFNDVGLLRKLRPKFSSDVWALGATLFALRFGEYPFVYKSEIEERGQINARVRDNSITVLEGTSRKDTIRENVQSRISKPNAYKNMCGRIEKQISGSAAEILISMLSFDESARLPAVQFAEKWSSLARDLGGAATAVSTNTNKWEDVRKNLNSVLRQELAITNKQLERLAVEVREEKKKSTDKVELKSIEALITKIKGREKVPS